MKKSAAIILASIALSGCATWQTVSVDKQADMALAPTVAGKIMLSEGDVKDRPYRNLGEISVSVNKTTVFHADPTPALVNDALREKAATMGADAVLDVQYGKVGMSLMSWGTLQGKGRAVQFTK